MVNVPTVAPLATFSSTVFWESVILVGASLILLTVIVNYLTFDKPVLLVLVTEISKDGVTS